MAKGDEPRRAFARRNLSGVEMFCYRASASVVPQVRRNIGFEIMDISPGGARVRVVEPVPRGEPITLELRDRSSGESFRARGEVRWSETAGAQHYVGVQFREHYSPVELREYFTTGVRPRPTGDDDIVLAPAEKRLTPRFSVKDYVVTVFRQGTLAAQGLKRNVAKQVYDLSRSGAQMSVTETLEPGCLIQFTLHFNTLSDTLDALAAVRWCRPDTETPRSGYRIGLQFLNLPPDKARMVDFMRKSFDKKKK